MSEINRRIAAHAGLGEVLDFVFESTSALMPCDRISVAFLDESGGRLVSHWTRALYEPVVLGPGYAERIDGSTLERVFERGATRLIDDLHVYAEAHPQSNATRLLVREGVRSNLTCPLVVEGRRVGVLFRSSRLPRAYTERHVRVHDAIAERLGQAVLNAYRLEQVAEANRAYAETIGFVSHELKAPIASMLADTDVLLAGYAGPIADSQRARLEAIRRKGTGLLDLVRDYLDLARVEGGLQIQVQPEVDVAGALVDQAVELVRATMEARGMRIELARAAAGPIACDPDLVRIILVNLVSNAVKYGRDGGLVRIEAERREGKLAIAVSNEGPGFDAAARGKLFRRFGRLDDPELKSRAGTGLGLYTSWRIARLHGGSIDADSEPGRWARFTLTLPVAPTADREPLLGLSE